MLALTSLLSLLVGSLVPLLIVPPAFAGGIVYRYADAGGIVVYTNRWEDIPPSYRRNVERLDGETLEPLAPPKALLEVSERASPALSQADSHKPSPSEDSRNEPMRWLGLEGLTGKSGAGSSLPLGPLGLILASAIVLNVILYLRQRRNARVP